MILPGGINTLPPNKPERKTGAKVIPLRLYQPAIMAPLTTLQAGDKQWKQGLQSANRDTQPQKTLGALDGARP